MEQLAEVLVTLHIVAGSIGLAAYWFPIFTQKGARKHRFFGKVFVRSAYVALGAAALSLTIRLVLLAHRGVGIDDNPMLYGFIVFLAYLTFVTFVIVRHGMMVLRHKGHPAELATPVGLALARGAIAASVSIIVYAVALSPPNAILLYVLSPIGYLSGSGILRYMKGAEPSPRGWHYEHLGAMLGAGIAFHTAFAVFGATRLFDIGLTGWVSVIPWVLPTLIGVPATAIWTRHYRRKFGELERA